MEYSAPVLLLRGNLLLVIQIAFVGKQLSRLRHYVTTNMWWCLFLKALCVFVIDEFHSSFYFSFFVWPREFFTRMFLYHLISIYFFSPLHFLVKCFHRMLLSSCSRSCNCGDSCVNKPFQYRPAKKMKLIKVWTRSDDTKHILLFDKLWDMLYSSVELLVDPND